MVSSLLGAIMKGLGDENPRFRILDFLNIIVTKTLDEIEKFWVRGNYLCDETTEKMPRGTDKYTYFSTSSSVLVAMMFKKSNS